MTTREIDTRPAPAPARRSTAPAPARRSTATTLRSLAGALIVAVIAGLIAFGVAQAGNYGLYVLCGIVVLGIVGYATSDLLGPPLRDAVQRLQPARRRRAKPSRSGAVRVVAATAATLGAGVLAWFLAQQGTKAILAVVALLVAAVLVWLFQPLLVDLLRTPPVDVPLRDAAAPAATAPVRRAGRPARAVGMVLAVLAAGVFAWAAAQLGLKGLLALIGAVAALALLVSVRDRSVFFTFAAVCSLTFMLHKSFSTQDLQLSGGAPSIYISTFDAMLLLLYAVWISEGTFAADVRAAWQRRILWVPLIGASFLVPSLLVATSGLHSASEFFRMGWMYLLFFYVAVRVRTRRHIWAVLGGLAVFACIEFVVVVLQWKTGGVLGLSFLGVPTQLGERVTDSSVIGRPFGTIIHPVFMGAVMASLALVALALGCTLRRSLTKVAALALVPVCVLPLYLAHTRAALVAFALVALVVVAVALAQHYVEGKTVGKIILVLLVGVVLFWPQLSDKFVENFATGHFSEEVDSRRELNDLAGRMIDDHPVLGVGLNNFEVVMGPYEKYGIIFFGNPVHNLYLLYLSETGAVGFVGVVIVGVGLYNVAIRLARAPDRLLGGIGLGVSAAMGFLMVEELLGFSLRQDIPLALYWLLAGLAVAGARMAGFEGNRRASSRRRLQPTRDANEPDVIDLRDRELEDAASALAGALRPALGPPRRDPDAELRAVAREFRGVLVPTSFPASRPVVERSIALDELYDAARDDPSPDLAATWLDELARMAGPADTGDGGPPAGGAAGRDRNAGRARRPRWQYGVAFVAALGVLALLPFAGSSAASSTDHLRITFTATERATGIEGIYVANGDGTGVTRITPTDGRVYNWAQWAFGGTKIVFTVRSGPEGAPEAIGLMNPDGSAMQTIIGYDFRVGQPKVSPDGRSMVFTATTPWFREVALYRLDLETLEAENLSSVTAPLGSLHADPKFAPTGQTLIFANGDTGHTQVNTMNRDGTDRRAVTDDAYFNTDPEYSPNMQQIAIASYRGEGNPGRPGRISTVGVRPDNWFLVVRDAHSGQERVLTQGKSCVERMPNESCRPEETSAFKPVWTPDGNEIGYNGTLDLFHNCICVIGADGRNPRVVLAPDGLTLDWFDWTAPGRAPATSVTAFGAKERPSKLLVTSTDQNGKTTLYSASADLLRRTPLPVPDGLTPEDARWNADHKRVVFTARVPLDHTRETPHPAPPPGAARHEHFTLDQLTPGTNVDDSEPAPADSAQEQVFLREPTGVVRQLTDPWIEDWRDGLREGDARSNTNPVLSPDGRFVVFTNTSTVARESFLLRLDLETGDVLNLTNGTAGAMKVDDAHAQYSADGSQLAFTWTNGPATDVFVMDGHDGTAVTRLTDDDWFDTTPTWAPDGRSIVYASYRGSGSPIAADGKPAADGWVLVRVDVATRAQTVLTLPGASPTWNPVWAPEGDRVLYVGTGASSVDLFRVGGNGVAGLVSRPAQVTLFDNELSVDWK